eukprot:9478766-Pyramimonas_sp.AAC.1
MAHRAARSACTRRRCFRTALVATDAASCSRRVPCKFTSLLLTAFDRTLPCRPACAGRVSHGAPRTLRLSAKAVPLVRVRFNRHVNRSGVHAPTALRWRPTMMPDDVSKKTTYNNKSKHA